MVGKNNQQNQFKQRSEHMKRYGIRKLKVGVASVAIASCFLLPSAMSVSAAETKPVSTDQVRKMNQGAKENKKIKSKIQAYSSGQAAANLKQSALADNLQTKGNSVGVTDHQDPVKTTPVLLYNRSAIKSIRLSFSSSELVKKRNCCCAFKS